MTTCQDCGHVIAAHDAQRCRVEHCRCAQDRRTLSGDYAPYCPHTADGVCPSECLSASARICIGGTTS